MIKIAASLVEKLPHENAFNIFDENAKVYYDLEILTGIQGRN